MTETATRVEPVRTAAVGLVVLLLAWLVTLVASDLPDIAWRAVHGGTPAGITGGRIVALAALTALCLVARRVRPLWQYGLMLLVLYGAAALSSIVGGAAWWRQMFQAPGASFTVVWLGASLRDLGVAAAVIVVLLAVKGNRQTALLVKGRPNAPIAPIRWLGIRDGESWRAFQWIFGGVAAAAVLVMVLTSMRPSVAILMRALPLIPAVLLLSAINAFTEEVYFRASLLSTVTEVVGRRQALLLNVVLFGLAHYLYGSPPGMIGFAMTGFLAYLMAKGMLETRGLLCPWLIHFLADVPIFGSYALDWVAR